MRAQEEQQSAPFDRAATDKMAPLIPENTEPAEEHGSPVFWNRDTTLLTTAILLSCLSLCVSVVLVLILIAR